MDKVKNDIEYVCWNCSNRIGEECGINGREVYPDSEACDDFLEEQLKLTKNLKHIMELNNG